MLFAKCYEEKNINSWKPSSRYGEGNKLKLNNPSGRNYLPYRFTDLFLRIVQFEYFSSSHFECAAHRSFPSMYIAKCTVFVHTCTHSYL